MLTEETKGLKLLKFDCLQKETGLACAVSTRPGGEKAGPFEGLDVSASPVNKEAGEKNITLFCEALGVPRKALVTMRQRHTANVAVVEKPQDGPVDNTDCLVTPAAGVALMARSADCGLAAFYDPKRRALAVMHAGWRGALLNVFSAALSVMRLRYGTLPEDVTACVSPMISAANYPVREDFLEKLSAFYPEDYRKYLVSREGRHFFSLKELLRVQLELLGVGKYEFMHLCTYERKDLFFSWRRDGAACGHFGLMAMMK